MPPESRQTILVVDDNDAKRYLVARILTAEGFAVAEAETGLEALREADDTQPDLIVLDVNLPDVDGFEVCRRLKAKPATARIPVLHISARFTLSEDRSRALELGADAYLTVDAEPAELLAAVKALLRIKAAEETARRLAREWQATFDAIVDGVALADTCNVVVRCNAALAGMAGRPPAAVVGLPLSVVFADILGVAEPPPLADLIVGPERAEFERRAGHRWLRITLDPVRAGGSPVGGACIVSDVTARKEVEDALRDTRDTLEAQVAKRTAELARANENLRAEAAERAKAEAARLDLLRQLGTAQEAERRRVSRDLHDQTGQLLTGLSLAVTAASSDADRGRPVAAGLAVVQRLANEIGRQLHGLAVRLRPTALDDLGLPAALRELLSEFSARTGVAADFETVGLDGGRLPAEAETTLYRVVQEALTNVAKHAKATRVSVAITRTDGHATAVIEDDGTGFDPAAAGTGRLGLVGMRERVALVGGELEVESDPGEGTTVIAHIPVPALEGTGGRITPTRR